MPSTAPTPQQPFEAAARVLAALQPLALRQGQTAQKMLQQWSHRGTGRQLSAGALPVMDPEFWRGLAELQQASQKRLLQQQTALAGDMAKLAVEFSQLKSANTLSKVVEQQCNLLMQFNQLLSNQAVSLMTLQENIEVDYSYWLSQQAAKPKA